MFVGYIHKCDCCQEEFVTREQTNYQRSEVGKALKYDDLCPVCDEVIVEGVRMALTVNRGGLEVVGHTTPLGVLTTDQPTNQPQPTINTTVSSSVVSDKVTGEED